MIKVRGSCNKVCISSYQFYNAKANYMLNSSAYRMPRQFVPRICTTFDAIFLLSAYYSYLKINNELFLKLWLCGQFLSKRAGLKSRVRLKKHSVTKNCSDISLFKQIVLVQILGLQTGISKVFLDHCNFFFLTVGQTILVTKYQYLSDLQFLQSSQNLTTVSLF